MPRKTKKNKEQVVWVGTTTWERWDRYETTIQCRNRLKTALRALIKGDVKVGWEVPASKKHKGLYLKGEKKW